MRPILYKSDEKVFDSYGLGEIDATKATATRERNGNYTLYLEYPANGVMAPLFQNDMRIKADAGVRTSNQTFYISRIVRDSTSVIKIYAKHISHLTEQMALAHGVKVQGADAQTALNLWSQNTLGGERFDVWSDITTLGSTEWTVDKISSARDALGGVEGSILDIWGGEYEFDNTLIRLHKQLGRKMPTVLEYGRNILSAEDDESIESAYTSIYPFASYTPEVESKEGEEYKTPDPIVVTLPEKVLDSEWLKLYADRRVQIVDLSGKFKEKEVPTADKLKKLAEEYIKNNQIGKPAIQTKVEYVDLAKTLDYQERAVIEEVELCDIVPIYYPSIGLTNDEGKVVVVNYDVLNDRNESVEIGAIGQSVRSAMAGDLSNRVSALEEQQKAMADAVLPDYLLNEKGNKVWYKEPDNSKEHKVGDIWFEKNGLYDRLYIWNGEMWEKIIDTEEMELFRKDYDDQVNALKKEIDKLTQRDEDSLAEFDKKIADLRKQSLTPEAIDKALQDAGFKDSMDDIRKQLSTVSQTAKVNAELIGGDGSTSYNKNRLLGATSQDVTGDYVEVGHNGDGFEVGKSYVISWSAVCRPYGRQDVAVEVLTTFVGSGAVKLVPVDTRFPTIDKKLTKKSDSLLEVYLGQYRASFSGDWYQPVNELVTITDKQASWQVRPNFKPVADGQSAVYDGEWSDTPTLIFDGGGS